MERVSYIPPTPTNKLLRLLVALRILICDVFLRPAPGVPVAGGPFRTIALAGFVAHPVRTFRLLCMSLASPRDVSLRSLYFLGRFPSDDFDIVHCHYGVNGQLAIQLRRIGALADRTKIVTSFHGYDEHILSEQVLRQRYAAMFRQVDMFTANTEFTKRKIVALGADPAKVEVVPESLHVRRFAAARKAIPSTETVNLLTVARLVEKKGHAYAIDAIAGLKGKYKLIYRIAGDGPFRDRLQEQVRRLGLGDTVQFLGSVNQDAALELYRQADIFLLPSVTASDGEMEGQGLVLQEAQACGIPVISTFHNGIPEGVLDGKTGILVPEKDSAAITQALEIFIQNPAKRAEFGLAGRRWVESRYDVATVTVELDKIYWKLRP